MEVKYGNLFLKYLKKLKNHSIYENLTELIFNTIPMTENIRDIPNVKRMKGCNNRYRIRVGEYRIGIELCDNHIEMIRLLHRNEIYRYFP